MTEDGDKVLPGSRRPDGTIRRERRIRAGYVPQDEQPVYQSGGVMVRLLGQLLAHDSRSSVLTHLAAAATLQQQQSSRRQQSASGWKA